MARRDDGARGHMFQLRCIVLDDGTPRQSRAWGPQAFREPLLAAVRTWRFEPYRVKGSPEPITYVLKLRVGEAGRLTSACAPPTQAVSIEDCERYFEVVHQDENGPPPLPDEEYAGCSEGETLPARRGL
jgi:hypothetical protein